MPCQRLRVPRPASQKTEHVTFHRGWHCQVHRILSADRHTSHRPESGLRNRPVWDCIRRAVRVHVLHGLLLGRLALYAQLYRAASLQLATLQRQRLAPAESDAVSLHVRQGSTIAAPAVVVGEGYGGNAPKSTRIGIRGLKWTSKRAARLWTLHLARF